MSDLNTNVAADLAYMQAALDIVPLVNMRGLRRFRQAMGDVESALVTVWAYGDSITWGIGGENTNTETSEVTADANSWPARLRTSLARQFAANEAGFIAASTAGGSYTDSRVAKLGCTDSANVGPLARGTNMTNVSNGGAAGTITVSLPKCTAFDIIYWSGTPGNAQCGNFSYAVDVGGSTTETVTSDNDTYRTVAVTGLSDATHTVVITGAESLQSYIIGVRYHSGRGVCIGRIATPGFTSGDMLRKASSAAIQSRCLKGLGMGSPALAIFAIGHNDWGNQVSASLTPAIYEANLREAVTQVIADGGCCLLLSTPYGSGASGTNPVGGVYDIEDFWAVARAVATDTDHVAHMQVADIWGDAAVANPGSNNLQITNSVHPNRRGHGDIARSVVLPMLTGRALIGAA